MNIILQLYVTNGNFNLLNKFFGLNPKYEEQRLKDVSPSRYVHYQKA